MTFKIAGIALCSAVLYALVKQYKPEYAPIVQVSSCVAVIIMVLGQIRDIIYVFKDMLSQSGASSEYMSVLLKALACALITQFSADMCRDNGQSALATRIEFAGKVIIVASAIPILKALVQLITGIMNKI